MRSNVGSCIHNIHQQNREMNMKFTEDELELLRAAVSYMLSNIPDAEEALDIHISEDEVIDLELKLHEGNTYA